MGKSVERKFDELNKENYITSSVVNTLNDKILTKNDTIKLNIEELLSKLESIEYKFPKSTQPTHKEIITKLKNTYKSEKLVLVLGAGVSMSYGLPSWSDLLQKLMVTTIENDKNTSNALSKIFSEVFAPSPLIAGRYLQKYYKDNDDSFEESVRKLLYSDINNNFNSDLMSEIVKFCVAPGKSPNLNSIITYNFDDTLEQSLSNLNIEIPFKSIFGVGMNSGSAELPIYHVHGYLPQNGNLSEDNQITFGENVYHKQYGDIYSWNNIVQINKFRDFGCLFIGISLTDPNLRRLLDMAQTQKGANGESHFLFRKKYNKENIADRLNKVLAENQILFTEKLHNNLNTNDTVDFLIRTIESYEENDSASFGVKTIWVDDYNEIPSILKEIRLDSK